VEGDTDDENFILEAMEESIDGSAPPFWTHG
jgi:hypothetical protein